MSFQLGKKLIIINDPSQAPLLFYARLASGTKNLVETDDDFQGTNPYDKLSASPDAPPDAEGSGYSPATVADAEAVAQADMLRIVGFADLVGSDIIEVTGSKAVPGVRQVSTINFTVNAAVPGQELYISLGFRADDLRAEFASHLSDYNRKKEMVFVISPGETATSLATRIKNELNAILDSGWQAWVTATSAAGTLTLTSTDAKLTFTAAFSGNAVESGNVTAAFAVTTKGYSGRNTYEQVKELRLETIRGMYDESYWSSQIPVKGAKYSSYLIKKTVTRPDLIDASLNSTPTGTFEFLVYANEQSAAAWITGFTHWLNANVAKRTMYTAITADDVLNGDPVVAATTVDNTSPFTTCLI